MTDSTQHTQRERVALERREAAWPDRERDISWLAGLKAGGHCGESTSEVIARQRRESRIDRILAALDALPTQPTDEAVRGLVERLGTSAEAFREHNVYDMDGDLVRLIVQADEMAEAAALIRSQSAEIARLQALPLEGLVVDADVIWTALQDYTLSNMADEAGNGYPLVDLMSNDGTPIDTGRDEQRILADHIAQALQAAPSAPLVGGFGSGSSPDGDTQPAVEGPSGHHGWSWNYDLTHVPRAETVLFLGQRDGDGLERVWLTDCPNGPDENAVAWLSLPGAESAPLSPSQPVIRAGDET